MMTPVIAMHSVHREDRITSVIFKSTSTLRIGKTYVEGVSYEFMVLPFGLALSPHMFTSCLENALLPLREQGV